MINLSIGRKPCVCYIYRDKWLGLRQSIIESGAELATLFRKLTGPLTVAIVSQFILTVTLAAQLILREKERERERESDSDDLLFTSA